MAGSTLQEWLNRNAYRAFPFVEDTDFSCSDGNVLPKSVVLDARFCMFDLGCETPVLTQASIYTDGTVELHLRINGKDVELGPGSGFMTYADEASMTFARIAVGSQAALSGLAGLYRLNTPAPFLSSRTMCIPYGIGADTLSSGGVEAVGEVRVEDGYNSTLDIRANNLVLNVRKGAGRGVDCALPGDDEALVCDGSVLRFLNGQKADSDGNIQIMGGDGISVVSGTYKGMPAVIILTSAAISGFTGK